MQLPVFFHHGAYFINRKAKRQMTRKATMVPKAIARGDKDEITTTKPRSVQFPFTQI